MEIILSAFGQLSSFTTVEWFGVSALILHLSGYAIYAKEIFGERIRPNLISWLMWLFGGMVDLVTYSAIETIHWSVSALPIACVVGIGAICLATLISQIRNRKNPNKLVFIPPERVDYYMVGFDFTAFALWRIGLSAAIANFIAVGTSIITFIPIWRTTFKDPTNERAAPWIIWTCAYACMLAAVFLGESSGLALYFFPVYYLILHFVMVILCLRIFTNKQT